jgi:Xaa-Pro dipeptidase
MQSTIGNSTAEQALERIRDSRNQSQPITAAEHYARMEKLREYMKTADIDVFYLDATTSLRYFTGLFCYPSERLHGALISVTGDLVYICPEFEAQKINTEILIAGDFALWQEHEDPTALVANTARKLSQNPHCTLALDHQTPFFTASRLQQASNQLTIINGEGLIAQCRRIKSAHEIQLLQHAKSITETVQELTASILYEGIDTREVKAFLDNAHRASGMDGASTFKIVLFGEATAYPHGVPYPQKLKENDMVLIDTGSTMHGYHSDITRSYVFGEPNAKQREIWDIERAAQIAAFEAAKIGAPCSAPDLAARKVIEAAGLGPGYQTPGLPHRTGHGVGMDIHEHPYIVQGNDLIFAPGMCFSIEPMICCYGEFGVRLEDHAYIDAKGSHWFTQPMPSIDNPFGNLQ